VAPFNCASGSGMRRHLVSTTRAAGHPRKMSAPTSGDRWGTGRSGPRIPGGGERHRRRATISALRLSSFLPSSMQGVRRTPWSRRSNWSAAELGLQVGPASWTCKLDLQRASVDPAAISLGRERILAETLRQRGNRVVTNKQFGHWSYGVAPPV
jgi:hypothetical protein